MEFPCFKNKPQLGFFAFVVFLIPSLYYFSVLITKNQWIVLFQIIFFGVSGFFLIKIFKLQNGQKEDGFFRKLIFVSGISLLVTIVLNYLLKYWVLIFPPPKELEESLKGMLSLHKDFGVMIDLFSVAFVPAICEEVFFRGFFQTGLSGYLNNPKYVVVLSALFFAFYHLNPWFFPFYFCLGFLFGFIFYKTKNLGFAILAHFINNAYGIVLYHFYGSMY